MDPAAGVPWEDAPADGDNLGCAFCGFGVCPDARLFAELLVFRRRPEDEASDPDKDDAASFKEPMSSRTACFTGKAFRPPFTSPPPDSADSAIDVPAEEDKVNGVDDELVIARAGGEGDLHSRPVRLITCV